MEGTDFGFSFDIYRLDNSFNMTVNGKNVITPGSINTTELQFQSGIDSYPRNLKFEDGSQWGGNNVSQIYNLFSYYGSGNTTGTLNTNTPANWSINKNIHTPIFKIIIDVEGQVSLYGRKTNTDLTFYKIVPTDGAFTFNQLTWHKDSNNTVIISQAAEGVSAMFGYGRGYKLILCP